MMAAFKSDCLTKGSVFLNVTDVRIKRINTAGKMRAIVSITFDDAFVVRDIRIIEGENGLFIAMPSRKTPDGEYRDIAHPITQDARTLIEAAILKEYETA
jgi:stage V sporulation protein G